MKKEKLATQDKSKPCSLCDMPSVETVQFVGGFRRLCQSHYNQWKRKDLLFPVTFTKAKEEVI